MHRVVAGDIEAPKVDAPQLDAAAAAAVAAVADGNVQNVDFKNLSAEEAFQVLGVRVRMLACPGTQHCSQCPSASTPAESSPCS